MIPTIIRVKKKISRLLVGVFNTKTSNSLMKTSDIAVQLAIAKVNGILFSERERKKILAPPKPK
jgi:hypothetical protein